MSLEKRISNLEAELERRKKKFIVFWQTGERKETPNWKDELLGDSWIHTSSQDKLNEIKKSIEEVGMQPVVIIVEYRD